MRCDWLNFGECRSNFTALMCYTLKDMRRWWRVTQPPFHRPWRVSGSETVWLFIAIIVIDIIIIFIICHHCYSCYCYYCLFLAIIIAIIIIIVVVVIHVNTICVFWWGCYRRKWNMLFEIKFYFEYHYASVLQWMYAEEKLCSRFLLLKKENRRKWWT